MPLYEYKCDACAHQFERIQKFSDPLVDVCPSCGGHVQKLPSSPAIKFKGTGWYITDYAKKSSPDSGKGDGSKGESKQDSKSSESSSGSSDSGSSSSSPAKTESKSDSKSDSKSESKSDSKSDSK